MVITQTEVAQGVGSVITNPELEDVIPPVSQQLVRYITKEVNATERPSKLIMGGNLLDRSLRRRIIAERLTVVALHAEAFGAKEDKQRAEAKKRVIISTAR